MERTLEVAKSFGETVRRLRQAQGWSQEHFAIRSAVDRGYMGRIERGETNLTLKQIVRIADCLGVEVYTLFINDAALNDLIAKYEKLSDS